MRRAVLSFVLVTGLLTAVAGLAPGAGADPLNLPANVAYTSSTVPLQDLGTVNLTAVSAAVTPTATVSPSVSPRPLAVDNENLPTGPRPVGIGAPTSTGTPFTIQSNHSSGVTGFEGISGPQQAAVNATLTSSGDLEPPDQGGCVGPDGHGQTIVGEIINNAVSFFTPSGTQVLPVTATYSLFNQPQGTFLSDPRCYYDWPTHRWFFTEFVVGSPAPSTQFIAVSKTSDPLGNYGVFGIDTTDAANSLGDCPCFGDFDQIGADANGFYITTNEFSNLSPAPLPGFNGTVIYAISKFRLELAADGFGLPSVARYAVTADSFNNNNNPGNYPYHLSPSMTPQNGQFAWNTEYFVESNSNLQSDNHLIVYALTNTFSLLFGGTPTLAATEINSEGYAFPPDATQKPGTLTLGPVIGTDLGSPFFNLTTPQVIQNDFNAVQQVTYTDGNLYAELDTASGASPAPSAAAWFIIDPSVTSHGVSASISRQGYVVTSQNLMYPDIVVNSEGNGYMDFSVSGSAEYPSPAYVAFDSRSGPEGTVNLPTTGAANEDGFTCYLPSLYGGPCRWGDYSGGAVWNGTAYLMTEYIPPSTRDFFTNWGTFIFSASTH